MFKEKLQDVITEKYLSDKISTDRFVSLMEKVELVSEKKAQEVLSEVNGAAIKAAIGSGAAKVAKVAKKVTGVTKQQKLYQIIKSAKADMKLYKPGTTDYARAKNKAIKAAAMLSAIGGAQVGTVAAAGYGVSKATEKKK